MKPAPPVTIVFMSNPSFCDERVRDVNSWHREIDQEPLAVQS
jgi:hypothetical protein